MTEIEQCQRKESFKFYLLNTVFGIRTPGFKYDAPTTGRVKAFVYNDITQEFPAIPST